jgi:hypothetical protein
MNSFDFARMFWVFGVSLKVIQVTNDLADFKVPRALNRKKLKITGWSLVGAGVVVAVLSAVLLGPNSGLSAVKGTGQDIVSLGFSCLFQLAIGSAKSHKKWYDSIWWVMIMVGLVFASIGEFRPFYIGNNT